MAKSVRQIEPQITEADRLEHRRACVNTAARYKMWDTGCSPMQGRRPITMRLRFSNKLKCRPHIAAWHTT